MERPRKTRLVAYAILLGLVACSGATSGGGSAYGTGDPKLVAPNPIAGAALSPFLANGRAVLSALDAVAKRSGTPFRTTDLNADSTNGLTVQVQVPKHPDEVDQYVVAADGTISGPTPVKLVSMSGGPVTARDVDAAAVDPAKIGLGDLTKRVREAIAKTRLPDARVTTWEYGGGPNGRKFLYLESARARPTAQLGPHFEIIGVSF